MTDAEALKIDEQATAGATDPARGPGVDPAEVAGQEVIDAASPEAKRVALQLGTLFRRMLSYGAATSALLDAAALGLSFLEFKA
ncbi:MAG TPA: hypothetical protein PLS38_06930, partial [Solirubrobacterales bacterium]|nr:hypothetical protein [Solirubrobacterales bacterium]